MSQLLSYAHAEERAVESVVHRIEEISTLPQVALRVMQIANDPDSGAADLKQAMESDTALSARVLRCVNSSAYAARQKIANLQQAIAYLGMKQIRDLAVTASVSELFKTDDMIGPYRRAGLWRHLVSVGICARMLANRLKLCDVEDMFLAGLLHDLGIILEDQYVHEAFYKLVQSLGTDKPLAAVERDRLGFDHTTLGAKIGEIWGFPDTVKAAIRYHHRSSSCRSQQVGVVRCVEVANLICTCKGIPSVGLKLVKCSRSVLAALSLSEQDLGGLSTGLDAELAANSSLFHV